MLPKKNRATSAEIDHIFQKGRFVSSPNLTLKFVLRENSKNTQISLVAPKTSVKSAVKRNLLRRRGYSILDKHLGSFPSGLLGAIIFGKKSLVAFGLKKTKNYNGTALIENEIKTLLNKIN